MKYRTLIATVMLSFILGTAGIGFAQLDNIIYGTVQNPDASIPLEKEIVYRAYLTSDIADTTAADSCSDTGGWQINLMDFAAILPSWQAGDTLVVLFTNIGTGTFAGARSSSRYVTKSEAETGGLQNVGNTALPVEMVSFAAACRDRGWGYEVALDWKTVSETNNFGFEVLRSQNGQTFEKIAFLSGAGSTTAAQSYSYVDKDVVSGKYYYRLKQIDTDGQVMLSDIKEINLAVPDRYELGQNFPNPFNPTTEIMFKVKEEGRVQLVVFDLLGREVATLVDGKLAAGIHKINFDGRSLPSGMYLYVMKAGSYHQVKKMALIK
ncbi:MAG TPA: T9SS type A sorting domain-containing protein [bacterium]|mgnify:FL=1|nr:T9SS type A sorting domain-containing protein [bacterium]HPN36129.1 T9SS type A sorting domain-containing protein [bacterium]